MTEPYVRADVRAFLDRLKTAPLPKMNAEMIPLLRQAPPEAAGLMDLPVGDLARVQDIAIPGPAGTIAARLFDPRGERGPGPVAVFFHGGGFVVGGIESHAGMAAEIARRLDLPVVSVEYRLAPENPWPAAPDDAEAAARWVAANGAAIGCPATGLVLCGDSAGATLTIVTALALRDAPAACPVLFQMPFYPVVDRTRDDPSSRAFANGYLLEADAMAFYNEAYAADPAHWRGAPLLADQAGLPPTLVVTAGLDPLRDQGRAYAAALAEAGVTVSYVEVAGQIHGFLGFRRMIPSADADLRDVLGHARLMLDSARRG